MPQIETLGAENEDVLRETTIDQIELATPLSKPWKSSIVGHGALVISACSALLWGSIVTFPAETHQLVVKGHDVMVSMIGTHEANRTGRPPDTRDYVWYYGQYIPRAQLAGKSK